MSLILTGGADGVDAAAMHMCLINGHKLHVYIPRYHRLADTVRRVQSGQSTPMGWKISQRDEKTSRIVPIGHHHHHHDYNLTDDNFLRDHVTIADPQCRFAYQACCRVRPGFAGYSDASKALIMLNVSIVDRCDALFAFGWADRRSAHDPLGVIWHLRVKGDTGWSVELAQLLHKPVYVYDLQCEQWLTHLPQTDMFTPCGPPQLTPVSAIVGSRRFPSHLGAKGYNALFDLILTADINYSPEERKNIDS